MFLFGLKSEETSASTPSTTYVPQRRQIQRSALNQSRSPYGRPEIATLPEPEKSEPDDSLFNSITATLAAPVSWFTQPTPAEKTVAPPAAPKLQGAPQNVRVGSLCGDMHWLNGAEGDKRNAVFTGRNLNMRKEVISDFWMKPRAMPSFSSLSGGWYSKGEEEVEEIPKHKTIGEGEDEPGLMGLPPSMPKSWNRPGEMGNAEPPADLPDKLNLNAADLSLTALNPPSKPMVHSPLPVPIRAKPGEIHRRPSPMRINNARSIERRPTPFRRPPSARRTREAAPTADQNEVLPPWAQSSPSTAAGKWRSGSPGMRQGAAERIDIGSRRPPEAEHATLQPGLQQLAMHQMGATPGQCASDFSPKFSALRVEDPAAQRNSTSTFSRGLDDARTSRLRASNVGRDTSTAPPRSRFDRE